MLELTVPDMTCGSCVRAITKAVQSADPEAKVDVSLSEKRVRVESALSRDEVEQRIAQAGFTPNGKPQAARGCC